MGCPLAYILAINISSGGIPKTSVYSSYLTILGFEGDGHNHEKHRTPLQAVCLQDIETLTELRRDGYSLVPGQTGENLTVRNLAVNELPLGTRLEFSSGVILEVTKVRKPCYVLDSIHPKLKEDIANRCGIYARVMQEGRLTIGDSICIAKPASSSFL